MNYEKPDGLFWILFVFMLLILFGIILSLAKPAHAETMLSVAQSQIGLGEIGGNNQGIYVRQYLQGQENLPWCAGFISWCAKKAQLKIPYFLRAKSFLKIGKQTKTPKPGDIVVFSRQGGGHAGIVEKVTAKEIITIEGNVGDYPAVVKRKEYNRDNIPHLLAFIRI